MSFTITTNADWDAGSASISQDVREVQGYNQNARITDNSIGLGNKYSDRFQDASSDGSTFNWSDGFLRADSTGGNSSGSYFTDIQISATNGMRMEATRVGGTNAINWQHLDIIITGSTDYIMRLDANSIEGTEQSLGRPIGLYYDANNYILFQYNYAGGAYKIIGNIKDSGVETTNTVSPFGDKSIWVRAYRNASGNCWIYYDGNTSHSIEADDFVWTTLHSEPSASLTEDLKPNMLSGKTTNNGTTFIDFFEHYIKTGVGKVGETSHRTSGNWWSSTITMPTVNKLDDVTLTLSNGDSNNYIDTVEILRDSDNAVLYTASANQQSTVTLDTNDFTPNDGFQSTAGVDIKVKVYLVGEALPAEPFFTLDEISGTFALVGKPGIVLGGLPSSSAVGVTVVMD